MTRTRVRLAVIVLIAVVIYTAFIAVMVESNNSGLGILVMLGASLFTAITLGRRPLMMIAVVVGIIIYTFSVAVSTQVATGREDDPFENCTLANNWQDLIGGEECE